MIKFSNLYKLISEGLYITDDNKFDYHPIDNADDLIMNHPTPRLYTQLPYNQQCYITYIIPNINTKHRKSVYHTLKQYFSLDYTPNIPKDPKKFNKSNKNIIPLSNQRERGIKAPFTLEYINRLFDTSIGNFLHTYHNIEFDLILKPTSHSQHINMFFNRFKQYIKYDTQYSTIHKLTTNDVPTIADIKLEFPDIDVNLPQTSLNTDKPYFYNVLKNVKKHYDDNNSLGKFANQFIIKSKIDIENFYILLSILLYELNLGKKISLKRDVVGQYIPLIKFHKTDICNALNITDFKGYPNIAEFCKNITTLDSFGNIKNILVIDDNINDGTSLKTDGKIIRNQYPDANILWYVLIGDEVKITNSSIFGHEVKITNSSVFERPDENPSETPPEYEKFDDIYHTYNYDLYSDHKQELEQILNHDTTIQKTRQRQLPVKLITQYIEDYKSIPQNKESKNYNKLYEIVTNLYPQCLKIFDKVQFANLNSKLKYIFNAIPNSNTIKNKKIRDDFYEKCNNFIQFITTKPNDYISIAKEKGLIN